MDTGGAELFEQWKGKQEAMGRPVPVTTAPYYATTLPPKRGPHEVVHVASGAKAMCGGPGQCKACDSHGRQ